MGTLYLVGTPIGNLEDMSMRAIRVLREVSLIAAEDTRHTRKLLSHFDIHTPMISYHEHNQRTSGPLIIAKLRAGTDVALVTDAGMPAVSDPGEDLVRLAVEAGIVVVPIPGPTAMVTALVVSGFPTHPFSFEGFLPAKRKERRKALERLRTEPRTWIVYEAPHRITDLLVDLKEIIGDRPVAAARELTKLHEQVLRGTPAELLVQFELQEPRGEFVVVVSGCPAVSAAVIEATPSDMADSVSALEHQGIERKAAMKQVAERYGLTKRDVYQAILALKEET